MGNIFIFTLFDIYNNFHTLLHSDTQVLITIIVHNATKDALKCCLMLCAMQNMPLIMINVAYTLNMEQNM